MEEIVRPTGVKMIARFEALAGIGLTLFGLGLVALSDLIPLGDISISHLGKEGVVIYGSASIVLGILSFLVALGIWSLKEWGRRTAILSCLAGIFVPLFVAGLLGEFLFVFNLIVYPLVIFYLSVEDVREKYK